MVPSEISACGGDAIRFSQIKSKVIEMIKLRNPSRDGSDKEIIELHGAPKAKFNMDHEMEDKICDFSDVYVQGMDEIKSSDIRKFYIQDHETSKRKTLEFDEDLHGKVKLVAAMVNDTNAPVSTFPDTTVPGTPELNQNLSTPAKRFSPSSPAPASNRLSKTA